MSTASPLEQMMLKLINQERAAVGVGPVTLDDELNESSEDHSAWMLNSNTFSHTGASNSSPTDRMKSAGFDFEGNWASGENIAYQSERGAPGLEDDIQQLHDGLMNSPGHRANILNSNFDEIGIGIERGNFTSDGTAYDSVMVTQNFARTDAADNAPTAPEVPNTPTAEITPPKPENPTTKDDEVADAGQNDTPNKPDETPPADTPVAEDKPNDPKPETPTMDGDDVAEGGSEETPETPVNSCGGKDEPETPVNMAADDGAPVDPETPSDGAENDTPVDLAKEDGDAEQPETPVTETPDTETPDMTAGEEDDTSVDMAKEDGDTSQPETPVAETPETPSVTADDKNTDDDIDFDFGDDNKAEDDPQDDGMVDTPADDGSNPKMDDTDATDMADMCNFDMDQFMEQLDSFLSQYNLSSGCNSDLG